MMYEELVKRLRIGTKCFPGYILYQDGGVQPFYLTPKDLEQAADAIEELSEERDIYIKAMADEHNRAARLAWEHRWIPVTERLPEEDESVFVVRKFLGLKGQVPPSIYVEIAYRIGDGWVADSDEYKIARNRHTDPLYWMPLPEPPKDGEA